MKFRSLFLGSGTLPHNDVDPVGKDLVPQHGITGTLLPNDDTYLKNCLRPVASSISLQTSDESECGEISHNSPKWDGHNDSIDQTDPGYSSIEHAQQMTAVSDYLSSGASHHDGRNDLLLRILDLERQLIGTLSDPKSPSQDNELHAVLVAIEEDRHIILDNLNKTNMTLTMKSMVIADLSDSNKILQKEVEHMKEKFEKNKPTAAEELDVNRNLSDAGRLECSGWKFADKVTTPKLQDSSEQLAASEIDLRKAPRETEDSERELTELRNKINLCSVDDTCASHALLETIRIDKNTMEKSGGSTEPEEKDKTRELEKVEEKESEGAIGDLSPISTDEKSYFHFDEECFYQLKSASVQALTDLKNSRDELKNNYILSCDSHNSIHEELSKMTEELRKSFLREEILKKEISDRKAELMTCSENLNTRTSEVLSSHIVIDNLRIRTAGLLERIEELENQNMDQNMDQNNVSYGCLSNNSNVFHSPSSVPTISFSPSPVKRASGLSKPEKEERLIASEELLRDHTSFEITDMDENSLFPDDSPNNLDYQLAIRKNVNQDEICFVRSVGFVQAQEEIRIFADFLKGTKDVIAGIEIVDDEMFDVEKESEIFRGKEMEEMNKTMRFNEESEQLKKQNDALRKQTEKIMTENIEKQTVLDDLIKCQKEDSIKNVQNGVNVVELTRKVVLLERELFDLSDFKACVGDDKNKIILVIKALQSQRDDQLCEISKLQEEMKAQNEASKQQSYIHKIISNNVPFSNGVENNGFVVNNDEEELALLHSRSGIFQLINNLEKATICTKSACEEFTNKVELIKKQKISLKELLIKNKENDKEILKLEHSIEVALIKAGINQLKKQTKINELNITRIEHSMEDALGRFRNCSDDEAAKIEFTNSESQKRVWKKMIKKRIEYEVQVNELIRLLNLSVTGMKGDGSNNKNDSSDGTLVPWDELSDLGNRKSANDYSLQLFDRKRMHAKTAFDLSEMDRTLQTYLHEVKVNGEKYVSAVQDGEVRREKVAGALSKFNIDLHARTTELNHTRKKVSNVLTELELTLDHCFGEDSNHSLPSHTDDSNENDNKQIPLKVDFMNEEIQEVIDRFRSLKKSVNDPFSGKSSSDFSSESTRRKSL